MAKKFWISDAIKHPGSLTNKMKKSGKKSISEYCASKGLDITTKKQCSLAKTLSKFNK